MAKTKGALDDTLNIRINSKEKAKFIKDNDKRHAYTLRKFINGENEKNRNTTSRRK